jgi:hypothetical protein
MSVYYRCALIAAPIVLSTVSSYAGPCSPEINRMQSSVDAISVVMAATGPPGRQTTAAMTHRQPTPSSIAEAEAKLAEEARAKRAMAALAQARAADRVGECLPAGAHGRAARNRSVDSWRMPASQDHRKPSFTCDKRTRNEAATIFTLFMCVTVLCHNSRAMRA